jgi:hypothetical protein
LGVLHTTASEQLADFTDELRRVLGTLQSEENPAEAEGHSN